MIGKKKNMNRDAETRKRFDRYTVVFMIITAAISVLVVMGWVINKPVLASFGQDYLPMAPVTAVLFLGICAVWLIQRIFDNRAGIRILVTNDSSWTVIVNPVSLASDSSRESDLTSKKLLTPNPPAFGQITTGRMSPLTASGFILVITSYYLLNGREPERRKSSTAAIISLIVLMLSGVNCLGYLYRAPFFYGGTLIPVALPTALSFLIPESGSVGDCWSKLLACQDVRRNHNQSAFDAYFYSSINFDRRTSGLPKFIP